MRAPVFARYDVEQRERLLQPTASSDVDEVVALGASLYAAFKSDKAHLSSAQKVAVTLIGWLFIIALIFAPAIIRYFVNASKAAVKTGLGTGNFKENLDLEINGMGALELRGTLTTLGENKEIPAIELEVRGLFPVQANVLVDEFVELNSRRWKSQAFKNSNGLTVIVAAHPSWSAWNYPASDITPLLRRCLER